MQHPPQERVCGACCVSISSARCRYYHTYELKKYKREREKENKKSVLWAGRIRGGDFAAADALPKQQVWPRWWLSRARGDPLTSSYRPLTRAPRRQWLRVRRRKRCFEGTIFVLRRQCRARSLLRARNSRFKNCEREIKSLYAKTI